MILGWPIVKKIRVNLGVWTVLEMNPGLTEDSREKHSNDSKENDQGRKQIDLRQSQRHPK